MERWKCMLITQMRSTAKEDVLLLEACVCIRGIRRSRVAGSDKEIRLCFDWQHESGLFVRA